MIRWSCEKAWEDIMVTCPKDTFCNVIPFCLEPIILSLIISFILTFIIWFITKYYGSPVNAE